LTEVALRFTGTDSGLSARFAQTNKSLDDLVRNTARVSSAIDTTFKGLAVAAAAVGLGRLINEAIQFADELTKASARTGIAVDNLQRLQFVADQTDVEFGSLVGAVNRLQVQLVAAGEGSKEATAALARLGIPVNEFIGLQPDEQFARVARSIAEIKSPTDRSAAAIGLFGRSGAELLPLLTQTGEELAKVEVQLDGIGGPVSATAIARVDDLGDSFGRLKLATKSLATELVALAEPLIAPVLEGLQHTIAGFRLLDGDGDNAIVNLSNRIDYLRGQIEAFSDRSDTSRRRVAGYRDELRLLTLQLEQLTGTGFGGLIQELALRPAQLDASLLKFSGATTRGLAQAQPLAPSPVQPSAQERREQTLSEGSPDVAIAINEKDLLTEINQEKLDELLRQETEHAIDRERIASDTAQFMADAREVFGLQEIEFEQIKNQSIISIAGGLVSTLAGQNTKLAKIQQGLAIATVTYDTSRSVMRAMADLPWPANLAAAAKAVLMGAVQIAKIKATNYSAGSVSGSGASLGGGASASAGNAAMTPTTQAPAATGATQGQVIRVEVNGVITKEAMRQLGEELGQLVNAGDLVFINGNSTQADIIRRGN
jgi:hypothetical protein